MKNKLWLHIGAPKTGTSSIQKFLSQHGHSLKESGFIYPEVGFLGPCGVAQHRFAFSANTKKPKWVTDYEGETLDSLRKELDDYLRESGLLGKKHDLILSSEAFSSAMSESSSQRIKEVFLDYDINVVVYYRSPDKWIESWYCQVVKNEPFMSKKFKDFYQSSTKGMTYLDSIIYYANTFGKAKVSVYDYDFLRSNDQDIIAHFLNVIGVGESSITSNLSVKRVNRTPSLSVIELFRKINEIESISRKERIELYKILSVNVKSLEYDVTSLFSEKERADFLKFFEEDMVFIEEIIKKV